MDTNNQEFFEDEEVQKTPVRKKSFWSSLFWLSRAVPDITSTNVRNQLKPPKIFLKTCVQ